MDPVRIADPPRASLLALLLAGLLGAAVADPARRSRLARLGGTVRVRAGDMAVLLAFDGRGVEIRPDRGEPARAALVGSMGGLVAMAGKGHLVGPVLSGRVRPSGDLLLLLRMAPLLLGGASREAA